MSIPKWAYKHLVLLPDGAIVPIVHHEYAIRLAAASGGEVIDIGDVSDYGHRFVAFKPAATERRALAAMSKACAFAHATTAPQQDHEHGIG